MNMNSLEYTTQYSNVPQKPNNALSESLEDSLYA